MHKTFNATRVHPSSGIMPSYRPFIIYYRLVNSFLYPWRAIKKLWRKKRKEEGIREKESVILWRKFTI
jgi:hypothetical protein